MTDESLQAAKAPCPIRGVGPMKPYHFRPDRGRDVGNRDCNTRGLPSHALHLHFWRNNDCAPLELQVPLESGRQADRYGVLFKCQV